MNCGQSAIHCGQSAIHCGQSAMNCTSTAIHCTRTAIRCTSRAIHASGSATRGGRCLVNGTVWAVRRRPAAVRRIDRPARGKRAASIGPSRPSMCRKGDTLGAGREAGGIRPPSTEHRCRGFVTDHDAPRSTPLDEVMRAFDVRSTDVVRVAGRIAREEGLGSISRGHFFR